MSETEAREQALLAEIPWLRQPARELARDVHTGDDLAQESSRIAPSRPPRCTERSSLRAWLPSVIQSASCLGRRALRWSVAACLAVFAACLAPRISGGAGSGSEQAALPAPSSGLATAPGASESKAEGLGARSEPQVPEPAAPWLAVCVRDGRTHAPLAGATVARARSKDWQELADGVDATYARLGIAGSAGSYLGLTREEALPSEPGTQDQPPFAPRDEVEVARTDREGRAVLAAKLPAGEHLVIRCEGRGARAISVADVDSAASSARELAVDLHPVGKLRVRVHTLEGEPVEDAFLRVEAVPFLPEYRPQRAVPLVDGLAWRGPTDEHGEFELEELPLDDALIVTPLSRCIGKPADVLLTAGAPARTLDLIVVAPGSVVGRMVGADGRPLANARIDCVPRRPWYSMSGSASTNEEGYFRLNGLPSGPQELGCTPGYTGGYVLTSEWPFRIQVDPFSVTDLGELVFGELSMCEGRFRGLSPELEGEFNRTRLELVQGERTLHGGVHRDGTFRIQGDPGPARLQLILATDVSAGRVVIARDVVLPCSDLGLDPAPFLATLAFRLDSEEDASQLAGAHLFDHGLDDSDGTPAWEGALSRYEFDRSGEAYELRTLLPGRYRLELQIKGGARSWVGEVELEAGKTRDLGTLRLGTATLSGTLAGGSPSSEVQLVRRVAGAFGKGAFGDREFDLRTSAIDARGSFRFDDLPAGLWCATASDGGAELLPGVCVDLRVGDAKAIELVASPPARIRCRARSGAVPVLGAIASYSFAREESLRPYFELNPRSKLLPSDREGRIEMGTFFPGPYRIHVEAGGQRIVRLVQVEWGQDLELDFDFGAAEYVVKVDLPEELLARLTYLRYFTLEDGPHRALNLQGVQLDPTTFSLRAPPSQGYVELWMQSGQRGDSLRLPITLRESERRITLTLPSGELVLRLGSGAGSSGPPSVCVTELPAGRIPGADSWLAGQLLEPLPDGRWLARGIPEHCTVRIQPGDQRRHDGVPPRFVQFESGRLELDWP